MTCETQSGTVTTIHSSEVWLGFRVVALHEALSVHWTIECCSHEEFERWTSGT